MPTLGAVPAGFLSPHLHAYFLSDSLRLLPDAAGIALICFCSSMVTAKSFAVRNKYEVAADREFIALGLANVVSGLSNGFAIAGADSRTAIKRYYRRPVAGGRIDGCPCHGIGTYSLYGPAVIYSDRFARCCAGLGWCIAFRLSDCVEDT